jgi:hypothetical protein
VCSLPEPQFPALRHELWTVLRLFQMDKAFVKLLPCLFEERDGGFDIGDEFMMRHGICNKVSRCGFCRQKRCTVLGRKYCHGVEKHGRVRPRVGRRNRCWRPVRLTRNPRRAPGSSQVQSLVRSMRQRICQSRDSDWLKLGCGWHGCSMRRMIQADCGRVCLSRCFIG